MSSPSTHKTQYCGEPPWPRGSVLSLRPPGLESCIWRAVSSHSSHHFQEVLLTQFSLYVHKSGLKPDSFHSPHSDWWILVCFTLAIKERSSQSGARTRDLRFSKQAVSNQCTRTHALWIYNHQIMSPLAQPGEVPFHDTLTQCWTNVGPESQTVAKHWSNIGSMSPVFWYMWSHHPKCLSHWNTCKLPQFRRPISPFYTLLDI